MSLGAGATAHPDTLGPGVMGEGVCPPCISRMPGSSRYELRSFGERGSLYSEVPRPMSRLFRGQEADGCLDLSDALGPLDRS